MPPHDLKFIIERWIGFWKDKFATAYPDAAGFQANGFHHRLRDSEHELETRKYIENNPAKAGLVLDPKTWPWSSARFRDEYGVLKL